MVSVDIWLFGKPEWEIDLDKATPRDIKDLGENLKDRLCKISEIVEKLENNGWSRGAGLYDLFLYKGINKEIAIQELEKLGIKENDVRIEECGEEIELIEELKEEENSG